MKKTLSQNFYSAFDYLLEIRKYIYFVIGMFLLFSVAGYAFSDKLSFLDNILLELIQKTSNLNWYELILFIFSNNFQASLIGFIFGIFFGLPSLLVIITNGLLLGYVAEKVVSVQGIFSLWRILPHGIFELPAVFISLALGLKLGWVPLIEVFKFYKLRKRLILIPLFPVFFILSFFDSKIRKIHWKSFKYNLYNGAVVFLFVVIPLLLIAAVIEGLLIAFAKT